MTTFERRGYFRRSKYGTQHWVSSTTVFRADWSRSSYSYSAPQRVPPPRDPFLDRYPEFAKARRSSACFVNPNARCPVCGESVYYYQNVHGSRVFFDELGPPWPKHPCTDTGSNAVASGVTSPDRAFEIRGRAAIAEISEWQSECGIDCAGEFKGRYGTSPWPLATIAKRLKAGQLVFLVLKLLQQGAPKRVYVSCKSLPKCCKEGVVVAIRKQKISFFDTAAMTPREAVIKRYRGAAAFVEAMIAPGTGDV